MLGVGEGLLPMEGAFMMIPGSPRTMPGYALYFSAGIVARRNKWLDAVPALTTDQAQHYKGVAYPPHPHAFIPVASTH